MTDEKTTKPARPDYDDFTVYPDDYGGVSVKCDMCRTRQPLGGAVYIDAPKKWAKAHRKAGCQWRS